MPLWATSDRLAGTEYRAPTLILDTPPVYPSVWLDNHPGQKPGITIYDATSSHFYTDLGALIDAGNWDDMTVTSFMATVIAENPNIFQVTPDEAWNANGRAIATPNAPCNPLDLLEVTTIPYPHNYDPDAVVQETRLSLFYGILLVYRKTATRSINEQYGIQTGRRLDAFFRANGLGMTQADTERLAGYLGNDKMTEGYVKIIAAIDMFFFHFSDAEFSRIRIATLPSRYKGCAALTSFGQIARMTGLSSDELGLFVYTEPVALEVAQIAKLDEGADDTNSYFPYQIDMFMTPKSPYSLSANPTLYLWLHTIGSILAYTRSINAKYPSQAVDVTGTTLSAAAVALNLSKGMNLNKQFATTREAATEISARIRQAQENRDEADTEDDIEEDDDDDFQPLPPADNNPVAIRADSVLNSLITNKGLLQEELVVLRKRLMNARTALPDTVGKYLANLYTGN